MTKWAASQSLAPTSISGVSLALGICAAIWFTAGTRTGNLNGAVALGVGYLAALSARQLASQARQRLTRTSAQLSGVSPQLSGASAQSAGATARPGGIYPPMTRGLSQRAIISLRLDVLVRAGWLALLGMRLTDCVVYAGLAMGAAAQGWTGMWPLAITVLSLVAIRDTMTACSVPAFADRSPADPPDSAQDHPDPAGPASARDDLARDDLARDDLARDDLARDDDVARGGPVQRAVVTVLTMPFGGRMLLIAVAAPIWGARASLLGLLDWAIIAVGYGIGSRTSASRRARKPARRAARPRAEPGRLAVRLQPPQSSEWAEFQAARPAGQQIPVLRMKLSPPPPGATLPAETEAGFAGYADAGYADAGFGDPEFAAAGYAGRGRGSGGLRDIGFAGPELPDSEFADADLAGAAPGGTGYTDTGYTDTGFTDTGFTDAGFTDAGEADAGRAGASPGGGGQPGERAARETGGEPGLTEVLRCRDDGAIARWFGRLVRGQLMPLPAALLALAAVAMLAHLGLRDLPGILILAPAIVMLVAAPGSSHPHSGRFDWLVPAVLQGAQYIYIAALGVATGVPVVLTFVLCAAIALHYADLGAVGSPERGVWMGWEGRMIICGLGAAMGIAMFVYVVLAAYVGGLICWKVMTSSLGNREGDRR